MSEQARRAVRLHSKATGGDLACLLELAGFCDERYDAFVCWPSERTLANFLHTTERQVRRHIARLRALGDVQTDKRGKRNIYTLRLPPASDEEYRALRAPNRTGTSGDDNIGQVRPIDTGQDGPVFDDTGQDGPVFTGQVRPIDTGQFGTDTGQVRPVHMKGSERKNEKKDEREIAPLTPIYDNLARRSEAEEEQTPSPLPPSPMTVMSAKDVWRLILDALVEEKGRHETDSWYARVSQVAWREDGALILRGDPSLMRWEQFHVLVDYALRALGAEIAVEYQERDERQERKARLAK